MIHTLRYRVTDAQGAVDYADGRYWQKELPKGDISDLMTAGFVQADPYYDFRENVLRMIFEAHMMKNYDIKADAVIPLIIWNATGNDLREDRHKVGEVDWKPFLVHVKRNWAQIQNRMQSNPRAPTKFLDYGVIARIEKLIAEYEGGKFDVV